MTMNLYVGTFTRFYTDQWERVAKDAVGPDGDSQPPPAEEVRSTVLDWRHHLTHGLGEHLAKPLDWDESDEMPYFTDRPGWDGYTALLLWTAHLEHPEFPLPAAIPACWDEDPAYVAACQIESKSKYRQILQPETWLPGEFDFCFQTEGVTHDETWLGSTTGLQSDLEMLNRATFQLDQAQLAACKAEGIGEDATLETTARFALAIFLDLVAKANQHHLPMMMSY